MNLSLPASCFDARSLTTRSACRNRTFGCGVPGFLTLLKKITVFPVPGRDVINETLPGRELLNYSRPGRVWSVTSRPETRITKNFFLQCTVWSGFSRIWWVPKKGIGGCSAHTNLTIALLKDAKTMQCCHML